MQTEKHLKLALTWLFCRGVAIDKLSLPLEYLNSQHLQELLLDNIHALKGTISVTCKDDISIFGSAAQFIRQVLVDRVDNATLYLTPNRVSHRLPLNLLPFRKLKQLAWIEYQETTDGQCLVSSVENNPLLESLRVCRAGLLPPGFFLALSQRSSTAIPSKRSG
jgi:hypothetical protein